MKLVHLVAFVIKKFVTMHGHMNVKYCESPSVKIQVLRSIVSFPGIRLTSAELDRSFSFIIVLSDLPLRLVSQRHKMENLTKNVPYCSQTSVCLMCRTSKKYVNIQFLLICTLHVIFR